MCITVITDQSLQPIILNHIKNQNLLLRRFNCNCGILKIIKKIKHLRMGLKFQSFSNKATRHILFIATFLISVVFATYN